ncbi:phage portal protein [Crassaminicella thermophila]|uniref:phage portal protein n=1 Tax=Crassaminicella thermophila TaxID=2599308 RepID=UPI00143D0634|nr:phage portal protein [Crassaminicella thermophila]
MYEVELIKSKLTAESQISDTAVIKDWIESDLKSQSKQDMTDGVNYYDCNHDILKIDFREYIVDGQKLIDSNKANNQLINPFHRLLVQQKIGYIAGKPVVFTSEKKELTTIINDILGIKFDDILVDWIKGASNKGIEWLHPFIDEEGNFDYVIIPAEQIIPIYDTSYQKNLVYIIRYYTMQVVKGDETEERYKVELWDKEKVTYFIEDDHGNFIYDDTEPLNPKYHWYSFNTNNPDDKKPSSWGKIPFINLDNNSEKTSDLKSIKKYIDAYDKVSSGFLNDLEDIQMAIWVLRGYEGTNLSEFMRNLIQFKAMKVSEEGGVDNKTLEIPAEARKIMLEILEDKIYEIGQGVKMSTDKFGQNPSGVALKFLYSGLDLKANTMIRKLKKALSEFVWFVTEYVNNKNNTSYDYKSIKFTTNKTIITNETEQIDNCTKSIGILSNETIIANHPWVDDAKEEIEKKKKEQEENMYGYDLEGVVNE